MTETDAKSELAMLREAVSAVWKEFSRGEKADIEFIRETISDAADESIKIIGLDAFKNLGITATWNVCRYRADDDGGLNVDGIVEIVKRMIKDDTPQSIGMAVVTRAGDVRVYIDAHRDDAARLSAALQKAAESAGSAGSR